MLYYKIQITIMSEVATNNHGTGILDAVSHSQQNQTLRELNPQQVVFSILQSLGEREREVIISRHGLESGQSETLEKIGRKLNLTRERVRQIEKEALNKLRKQALPRELTKAVELIYQILEEGGGIATQKKLLDTLLPTKTTTTEKDILFVFQLSDQFKHMKENQSYKASWHLQVLDASSLEKIITDVLLILNDSKKSVKLDEIMGKLTAGTDLHLSRDALRSYLEVSKKVGQNIFGEWGVSTWAEINPKDVGDKAYLVLVQNGEPQHYQKITEMINKQKFDPKQAHSETVHNELIKDKRFVLVGRGIYALKKWGYKKGTVADVIEDVIKKADEPLSKSAIIEAVLTQRLVKKNTISVGLSNKKRFIKTSDQKYNLANREE